MHRHLRVKEVIFYQAMLRLPADWSDAMRRDKIAEVMDLLDLNDIKESRIGDEQVRGISGGQRKRVNIGMELVADPTVLFLDEPTSGLDSTSSLQVLKALKQVATQTGVTIITVLHQPRYEIFCMFDEVLLLGKGGRTVYLGPTIAAESYFGHLGFPIPPRQNPADFYMDVIASPGDVDLFQSWETERDTFIAALEQNDGAAAELKHPKDAGEFTNRIRRSFLAQTWILFKVSIVLQRGMKATLLLDMILVLLGSMFLGSIYLDVSPERIMLMNTLSSMIIGLTFAMSSLRVFGDERAVFWRQSAAGLNRLAFFLAYNLGQLPMMLITPLVYMSVLYTLTSPRGPVVWYYLIYTMVCFAISGAAHLIACLVSPKSSQMAVVVYVLISSMLSGANPTIPSLDKITVLGPVLYSCSFARWMCEALFEIELRTEPDVLVYKVVGLKAKFGFSLEDRVGLCLGWLAVYGMVCRLLAYAALVLRNRGAQQ